MYDGLADDTFFRGAAVRGRSVHPNLSPRHTHEMVLTRSQRRAAARAEPQPQQTATAPAQARAEPRSQQTATTPAQARAEPRPQQTATAPAQARAEPQQAPTAGLAPHLREWARVRLANDDAEQVACDTCGGDVHCYCDIVQRLLSQPRMLQSVGARRIADMSNEEYTTCCYAEETRRNDELRRLRRDRQEELVAVVRASGEGGAIHCRSCGSSSVAVQQKQTRSADEGMTVFCACEGCGRQWRMG